MLNELFATIAAGILSAVPMQAAPAVVVPVEDVQSSIVQYIQDAEKRVVTIDCGFDVTELSVVENEPQTFNCFTTDVATYQQFSTTVTLTSEDGSVSISAIVGAPVNTPSDTEPTTTTSSPDTSKKE